MQAVLAIVLWWAVYWRTASVYGQGGGIVAATVAAWLYVLVSSYAAFMLNRRGSRGAGPRGPQPPRGRWPGASP